MFFGSKKSEEAPTPRASAPQASASQAPTPQAPTLRATYTAEPGFEPTPGMQEVQNAVNFIAAEFASASPASIEGLSNPLAEQAAAMLVEDVRGYTQSCEQMLVAATAQAMKLLLDPATQPTGTAALAALVTYQTGLAAYVGEIGTAAAQINKEF